MSSTDPHPRFYHDCDRCCFTGHYVAEGREADGWFCAGTVLGGSIVLRYGNDGPDYSSVPVVVATNYSDEHLHTYKKVLADYAALIKAAPSLQ